MTGRLALLGVLLATMPLAVDLPAGRDTTAAGRTQVEVAGGHGQFALVSRGCNGQVLNVTHSQLASGALAVEHRFPEDIVIGIRAGSVQTTRHEASIGFLGLDTLPPASYSNPYVNPWIGYDGREGGFGVGWLAADQAFMFSGQGIADRVVLRESHTTWHVRLGDERHRFTLRWMEDLPLESEGHLSADFGVHVDPRFETGFFVGLVGPYDGTTLGMRGRVWFTPEAALQIKASVAGYGQYGVYGSLTTGFRTPY